MPDAIISKYCPKCNQIKQISEFSLDARHSDGLQSWCRICLNAANKAYRQTQTGKDNLRAYRQSTKRKESVRKYAQSEKGKAVFRKAFAKWKKSVKGGNARRAYQSRRRTRADVRDYMKRYSRSKAGKAAYKRCRQKYPDAVQARHAVNHAIAAGDLAPAKSFRCHYCGKEAQQYHHNKGYAPEHWLDVIPLCRLCDRKAHRAVLAIC